MIVLITITITITKYNIHDALCYMHPGYRKSVAKGSYRYHYGDLRDHTRFMVKNSNNDQYWEYKYLLYFKSFTLDNYLYVILVIRLYSLLLKVL